MAKLQFIMIDDDGTKLATEKTIPSGSIPRIYAAYAPSYFPNGVEVSPAVPEVPAVEAVPAVLDADGNTVTQEVKAVPAVPAIPAVTRLPSGQEVVDAIGAGLANGIAANVISAERQQAQEAAAAAIAPMSVN